MIGPGKVTQTERNGGGRGGEREITAQLFGGPNKALTGKNKGRRGSHEPEERGGGRAGLVRYSGHL